MTNEHLKVSIVLPTYNGERYLRQSVESCLLQTHKNLELIIVDDGSSDTTPSMVQAFKDSRIRYCRHDQNQGLVKSLNKGFSLTRGDFLSWTSNDNYYAPAAIETMLRTILKINVDFAYADYYMINEDGKIIKPGHVEPPNGLDTDNYVGGCFLFKRKVYETIGDFHQEAFLAEDYEYWLRVREKFRMRKVDEFLYYFRIHEKSLTSIHREEKVQEKVSQIRAKFIRRWKALFLDGRQYYHRNDPLNAKKALWASLGRNPFYAPTWRLLALLCLSDRLIIKIRQMKQFMKAR